MGGPAAVESDHPDTTTPYWLGGYDSLLFYNGSSQTAICRTDRSRIDKAGVLGYRGTMHTRKRPLHQLISLVLIALISALSVAVPSMDRDVLVVESVIGAEGSDPVRGGDHDHRICVQYSSSLLAYTTVSSQLDLSCSFIYGTYWSTSHIHLSPAYSAPYSRAPPYA